MSNLTVTDQQDARSNQKTRPFAQYLAVFLCGSIAFLDLYTTQPLLPLLSRVFHATETHVALTISASTVGVAITSFLLASFGQAMARKRTIVGSMAVLAMCTLLTATATTLNTLAVWRLVQGLLTPGIFILTITYVTEEWPPLSVPRGMSFYVAGTVFGGFIGRLLGGVITAHESWRAVFVVLGVMLACGALVTHFLLAPPQAKRYATPRGHVFAPLVTSLRNPRLLATFGIGFCMLFTLIAVFSYITFFLAAKPFLLSTQQLSYVFAVYLFGLVATLIAGGFLARYGLRHGILGAITLCLVGIALTLIPTLSLVALGLAVCSSGVFIAQTCANSFLRDASPSSSRVAAVGLYICSYYIGGTFGGILPGIAYRHAHWPGCVALTGCVLCVAAGLAYFGWPARPRELDPIPL
jgi:YNFM family putative membrane transporter